MARSSPGYACSECGKTALAWTGQCPGCGAWNTLEAQAAKPARGGGRRRAVGPGARSRVPLRDVEAPERSARLRTGIGELDRVLGGGLVPGSLVLLGGAPGIGKRTLDRRWRWPTCRRRGAGPSTSPARSRRRRCGLRAERLGEAALEVPVAGRDLARGGAGDDRGRAPGRLRDRLGADAGRRGAAAPGSVGPGPRGDGGADGGRQAPGRAVVLIGHVTKEGVARGPARARAPGRLRAPLRGRARAHASARCARSRTASARPARSACSRCGRGAWSRSRTPRPASSARRARAPGSVVLCSMEGTRPLLVEVQALVAPTEVVPPRRTANGVDRNRLALVLAVLARHAGVDLVGGRRLRQRRRRRPGRRARRRPRGRARGRLGASRATPLRPDGRPLACFGEVGLTGELRYVAHADRRVGGGPQVRARAGARPAPADGAGRAWRAARPWRTRCEAAGAKRRLREAAWNRLRRVARSDPGRLTKR